MRFLSRITTYEITKRQKLVVMSFFLSVVLLLSVTVGEDLRYLVIGFLAISTVLLAAFSLWGEFSGVKYFLLLLLPVYFVVGASLFYFLLPVRWLTRVPFVILFGVSVYLLMLTSNIYNVAAIRTIALLRAAHAVGLLFSLVSAFFLINVLLSLHLFVPITAAGIFLITAPIYLAGLWSYDLEDFISFEVLKYTAIFSLVTIEIASVFLFWPVPPINGALITITVMYVLLGLGQFIFGEKLKPRIVWEHLGVAFFVALIVLLSTKWGG